MRILAFSSAVGLALVAGACDATLALAATGAASHRDPSQLRPGLFLYAAPAQQDPNFAESVVLLVEHGPSGSMGLVVNRPTSVPLQELLRGVGGLAGRDRVSTGVGPSSPRPSSPSCAPPGRPTPREASCPTFT